MQGLRTRENPKFLNFFEQVQKEAAAIGCVFFLILENARIFLLKTWKQMTYQAGLYLIPQAATLRLYFR